MQKRISLSSLSDLPARLQRRGAPAPLQHCVFLPQRCPVCPAVHHSNAAHYPYVPRRHRLALHVRELRSQGLQHRRHHVQQRGRLPRLRPCT